MKHVFSKIMLCSIALLMVSATWAQDIIVTTDAKKIEAKILEVSKSEIKYKKASNPDGPTFVLSTSEIISILYESGNVELYSQPTDNIQGEESLEKFDASINVNPLGNNTQNLARVESLSDVLIFTDCEPLGEYEILGDVKVSGGKTGISLIDGFSPYQYTDLRDQLVTKAVLANRHVEGIIIKILKEGEGIASMIKFKEGAENKDLARVNSYMGVMVFVDNKPINTYSSVGFIKKINSSTSDYNVLRNKLIKLCLKKFPATKGVIPHFVSGGYDNGEAIEF